MVVKLATGASVAINMRTESLLERLIDKFFPHQTQPLKSVRDRSQWNLALVVLVALITVQKKLFISETAYKI
jgi:hypothetical protein